MDEGNLGDKGPCLQRMGERGGGDGRDGESGWDAAVQMRRESGRDAAVQMRRESGWDAAVQVEREVRVWGMEEGAYGVG